MLPAIILALVAAVSAYGCFRYFRTPGLRPLSIAWLLYAGYETLMYARFFCTGECNIRVDLLLIAPALLVASAFQVFRVAASRPITSSSKHR